MLDSTPVPFQSVAWPLLGAAIVLSVGRFLPNWMSRLLALAAATASAVALWGLQAGLLLDPGPAAAAQIPWNPLNLFRVGPALHADNLGLLFGLALSIYTGIIVLGIRGFYPRRAGWHGLVLLTLAGCLILTMAANLLTLTLGSALVDLALVAYVVSSAGGVERIAWRMAVPGAASTLFLLASALQMNSQVGTTSLFVQELPVLIPILVGVAGLLRLMVYPLSPRELHAPEQAAMLILPVGLGVYLLYRVQAFGPVLAEHGWMLAVAGVGLLAGGLLAWSGSAQAAGRLGLWPGRRTGAEANQEGPAADHDAEAEPEDEVPAGEGRAAAQPQQAGTWNKGSLDLPGLGIAAFWPGAAIHQVAYALVFSLQLGQAVPWPLVGLAIPLGAAAIWWDAESRQQSRSIQSLLRASLPVGLRHWLETRVSRSMSVLSSRLPLLHRLRGLNLGGRAFMVIPTLVMVSLAGVPVTVGAVGRWHLYSTLLKLGDGLLIVLMAADTFLIAGICCVLGAILRQGSARRLGPAPLLTMLAFVALSAMLGIAPGILTEKLALAAVELPDVSPWGLGLVYVVPWLLGGWLARASAQLLQVLAVVGRILSLDWLYRVGTGLVERLGNAVYWLGQVGEGEGWWGWVLIILGLGTMFLTSR